MALVMLITLVTLPAGAAPRGGASEHPLERGLYVTSTAEIAGSKSREETLLSLVRRERFHLVVLYQLGPLLDSESGVERLSGLLLRLRASGVRSVGAPVASVHRVAQLVALARQREDVRFDLLVTELEYWNRCETKSWATPEPGIREPCFKPMQALVKAMQDAAHAEQTKGRTLRTAAYLGWPSHAEVQWLAKRIDLAFVDFPARSPSNALRADTPRSKGAVERIDWCAASGLEVRPIFYPGGELSMRPWLEARGLDATEHEFLERLASAHPEGRRDVTGFQYFADEQF